MVSVLEVLPRAGSGSTRKRPQTGPCSPGHQTGSHSTGLSLENTTPETQGIREGVLRNNTIGFRKLFSLWRELGSNSIARPWGYLAFFSLPHGFLPWLSWPGATVFPLEEFHSAQTVLLRAILVSSAGPEANKTVSKPSLSQLLGLEEFSAGKGKASHG